MDRPYQICRRCVMDTTDKNIIFDENGYCNHCRDYFKIVKTLPTDKELELRRIIGKMKAWGHGKPFDCMLGIGGGVDCSYTAYIAYKHGLRVLLLHMDNGWNTEEADYNIKALSARTGFPLVRYKLDCEEFNDVVLAFIKASVIDIEVATDQAAAAFLFQTAKNKGIKYILTGSNIVTEAIMPTTWGYRKNDVFNLKAIHEQFGSRKLETYPTMGFLKLMWHQTFGGIRLIPLLNHVDYNREGAKKILHEFCGWKDYGLKHWESLWTRFYQRYILPRKFGVDKRLAHLSTLVCSGQLTRAQALKELEKPLYLNGELEKEKTHVLKGLGLLDKDFEELMALPIKKHQEYVNDQALYVLLKTARNMTRFLMECAIKLWRKTKHCT